MAVKQASQKPLSSAPVISLCHRLLSLTPVTARLATQRECLQQNLVHPREASIAHHQDVITPTRMH